MPKDTIQMPAMMRDVSVRAETVNEEARTVDVVWSTGSERVVPRFFDEAFIEQLSMDDGAVRLDRLNNGAPVL
ncbi:peptidase U35, partial [Rhodobacteraceae bacterium WD3A24]